MDSRIKYVTTCKLSRKDGTPCGQQFTDHPFDIPIIGEPPTQRAMRFVGALGKHTASKHQEAHEQIANLGMQFSGFLITRTYDTQDPGLLTVQNSIRYHVHQMTRRVHVTDAHLQDVLAQLGFTVEDGAPVLKAMQELRDIYETEGVKRPQADQPQSILSPA
jgi:hypothetical protein